jgi:hypothetical protein
MAATITVVCPRCGKRMRASAEHVGRRGRCPACKALVDISAAAGEALESMRPADATRTAKGGLVGAGLTEVNTWIAGLIAIAATAVLYVTLFLPLRHAPAGTIWRKLGDYVLEGGWVIPVETLFACWGASLLVMKHLAVKRQLSYAELELELIPLEIGLQINAANIDQFLGHISSLP